jgi:pimeloyl-ACP methyl ester carboxylesterase
MGGTNMLQFLRRLAGVLSALAALQAVPATAAEPPTVPPEVAKRYMGPHTLVDVGGGRRINLLCMGEGEQTVLFDAGGSDWSVIWALVQPALTGEARACAYDRAGLGYSDPGRGPRSPIAIVEDMHALVKAAGLKRPLVLVGHSLGGFNVKLYAALYPEDVSALVLVDPAEERVWDRTRERMRKRFGDRLAARSELMDQSFFTMLARRYEDCAALAKTKALDPTSMDYRRCTDPPRTQLGESLVAERTRIHATSAYQAAQASEIVNSVYGDPRADGVYERLFRPGVLGDRPVIVLSHGIYDEKDELDTLGFEQFVDLHRQSARLSRAGRQRVVPGTHHNIELDAPEAVVAAVREALAATSRSVAR